MTIRLDDLRPGMETVATNGDRYLVLRRTWNQERKALTIELVAAGGPSDPRASWTPPADEVAP